ncbi:hypothetical protein HYH03_012879 [Edaphochlamys debaryana]|uniref:Guanylate cyclase domain-containing protein n=1 Tax=Edaphochlamys debaryana TaxID=47281 RepID=A0A836BTP4_9CHLO|nr:hypothetical protein HYH03_012879 [Edaphochlamys debaryana]|eukprot:KAG2488560.1 hypothetical protein HYH03_012879 [Edaphochlamys debaryana]
MGATNARLAVVYWCKTTVRLGRRHPGLLLAPLLLTAACLAAGLAGVEVAANRAEQSARNDAAAAASQTAAALALAASTPLQAAAGLAILAGASPSLAEAAALLPTAADGLLREVPVGSLRQLVLAPSAVVAADYLPPPLKPSSASGGRLYGVGSSLVAAGAASRADVLSAVEARAPILVGPSLSGADQDLLLVAHHPVYVPYNSTDGTAADAPPGGLNCSAVLAAACYDPSSGLRLWGIASAVLSMRSLAGSGATCLKSLARMRYEYRLYARPVGSSDELLLASTGTGHWHNHVTALVNLAATDGRADGSAAAGGAASDPDGGNRKVANGEHVARLELAPESGSFRPSWERPLIVTVVCVSTALGALLFAVLLASYRHVDVMRAMLPEKVIQVLSTGSHYYADLDCVAVLYADVVRYTMGNSGPGAGGGGGLPSLEVVKMLNDVHSMYDSIMKKYGLVKIRRSGEAFLAVAGCPVPEEPVAAAARVGRCARDMVLATSRYRGEGGFRVQLRVGVHSGPAVAAVVGTKMPRFSLFGDVVDVAYLMEATSQPMAIHVSERAAQLLAMADDSMLQLQYRRPIQLHGQGTMQTAWIRLQALPEPLEYVPPPDARPAPPLPAPPPAPLAVSSQAEPHGMVPRGRRLSPSSAPAPDFPGRSSRSRKGLFGVPSRPPAPPLLEEGVDSDDDDTIHLAGVPPGAADRSTDAAAGAGAGGGAGAGAKAATAGSGGGSGVANGGAAGPAAPVAAAHTGLTNSSWYGSSLAPESSVGADGLTANGGATASGNGPLVTGRRSC